MTGPIQGSSGGLDWIDGSVQGVTDERLAQRRIAMRLSASRVLGEWTTLEGSGPALLEVVGRRLGCEVATLWLPDRDVLRPRMSWMAPRLAGTNFERVTNGLRLPRSVGLVGWAWELGKPVTPDTVPAERGFVRREVARADGLQTAIAFPAVADDRVVAVIDLHTPEVLELAEQSHQALMGLGYEVGRVLAARLGQLEGNPLTSRETEILMLAAGGLSIPRIAELAGIERSTVKTHLDHIYAKLAVSNRAAAVAHALRKGLID
jgi:DNA-binding CsgD family transcriptional regulator